MWVAFSALKFLILVYFLILKKLPSYLIIIDTYFLNSFPSIGLLKHPKFQVPCNLDLPKKEPVSSPALEI